MYEIKDWAYGGVDPGIPGNGGQECVDFISPQQRLLETIGACGIGLVFIFFGLRKASIESLPEVGPDDRLGKRALTVMLSLIYGMEIGFKFASRTVVYILNPCHILTLVQIIFLAAPPSRTMTFLFRVHIHCLSGAVLAILFPILNTRELPFEKEVYWLQHILILIIPFYLIRTGTGGVYTVESLKDFNWTFIAMGFMFIYHFIVLQGLGLLTQVNLNNMLCPAVSDPFYGPDYRLFAIAHQTILILSFGKIYTVASLMILEALGTLVWTGEKYMNLALSRVQELYQQSHTD